MAKACRFQFLSQPPCRASVAFAKLTAFGREAGINCPCLRLWHRQLSFEGCSKQGLHDELSKTFSVIRTIKLTLSSPAGTCQAAQTQMSPTQPPTVPSAPSPKVLKPPLRRTRGILRAFSGHFLQVFALLIHELLKCDLGSLSAMRIPHDIAKNKRSETPRFYDLEV